MTAPWFSNPDQSHAHSLQTLDLLYEYDDFMMSVESVVDMGCGPGLDLEWWATRTTRDESPSPLNIRCVGVDVLESLPVAHKHRNITYQLQDFERENIYTNKRTFDVIWCHDAWQFVIDPFRVLAQWRQCLSPNGMLAIIVPQTTNLVLRSQDYYQRDYCYHHWTMISLIHLLAVSGFDCQAGHFLTRPDDPWLHALVYRSEVEPMDPRTTRWYDLADQNLLPESLAAGIGRYGYARQQDLVLSWLDHSLMSYHNH